MRKFGINKIIFSMILMAVGLCVAGCEKPQVPSTAEDYSVINPEADFTLNDQDGKIFHLKDHRGQVILLFFGYTSCPDVCPTTLSKLARVYSLLGAWTRQKL